MIARKDYDTAVGIVRAQILVMTRMRARSQNIVVVVNQYTRVVSMQNALIALFKSKDRKFNEKRFREDCNALEYIPNAAKPSKNVRLVDGKGVANDSVALPHKTPIAS